MSSPFPKTRWSRILRRTTTVLSNSSPTTPSIASDRDVDTASPSGSIKGPALKPPPSVVTSPSPIAESPIREAAAQETESPTGYITSPIIESSVGNHTLFTDEPDELPQSDIVHEPHAVVSVEPHVEPTAIPVPERVPEEVGPLGGNADAQAEESKPMIEANKLTVHGGKFTNVGGDYHDLRTRNTTYVVKNSTTRTEYLKNSLNPETHSPAGETQASTGYIVTPAADSAGDPGAFINPHPDVTQDPYAAAEVEPHVEPATIDAPEPVTVESTHQHEQEPKSTLTEALVEERTSYSDELTAESVKDFEPADPTDNTTAFNTAVHNNADPLSPELDHGHDDIVEYYNGDIVPATSEAVHENDTAVLPELDLEKVEAQADNHDQVIAVTTESERQEIQQTTEVISTPVLVPTYKVPSYLVNLGSGQEVWGGEHGDHPYKSTYPSSVPAVIPSSEDLKRVERSPAPSIRKPQEDPFADPIAPERYMTQPEILEEYHHDPTKTHRDRDMADPIVMPLISFHEVISKPIQHPLSRDGDIGKLGTPVETDENFPLLPRPGTPNKHRPTSYLQASAQLHSRSPHVPSTSQSTTSNGHANSWNPDLSSLQRRHTPSWTGYHLPDGTVYYVHPTSKVTTDINLGNERTLNNVERFLADHDQNHSGTSDAAEAGEMWLRDVGTAKSGGMVLERWWVDHVARTVVRVGDEREYGRRGSEMGKAKKGGGVLVEEDQLDSEYRYWSFMEAHPAHNPLPAKARMEAMNVLTWAWTERLLPSHRSAPAPFTQEDCQELMTLMRSFSSTDDHLDDYGIQTLIVSRVLIRVAHWRQKHLRPDKPLPANVSPSPSRLSAVPRGRLRRAIDDFLVSFRFIGVPLKEPKFP